MPDTLAPSDVLRSTSDELGDAIRLVRVQALRASGEMRKNLFDAFVQLHARQESLIFENLKGIDADPEIVKAVQALATLTQQIAKVRREMTTAKKAIDGAAKVLGFVDQFLGVLAKVVV